METPVPRPDGIESGDNRTQEGWFEQMAIQAVESAEQIDRPSDRFTPDQLDQFHRDGYVIVRSLVHESLRRRMLEATLDGLRNDIGLVEYEADLQYPGAPATHDSEGGCTIRRLKQAHGRHLVFTEWISKPELVGRLKQLFGPNIVMPLAHHNCIMTKQPVYSSDTGWHQDIRYWAFERPELVSVWLSLGREYPENGCLKLIPGTHRMQFDESRLDDALFLRPELPENQELIQRRVYAKLEPGDVLFFHCRTFHSASRNRTDQPKCSAVFTFRAAENPPIPGTRSASMPELLLPNTNC